MPSSNADRPLPLAAVFSVEGDRLTNEERTLFSAAQPFGFILFGRNCTSAKQLRMLTEDLRACVGWDCPILIDQEGGRVARLKRPIWDDFPAARFYGEKLERGHDEGADRLYSDMTEMAKMLIEQGIDVDCAPVMDVLTDVTHNVIGDRAYSTDPDIVTEAASIVCRAFLNQGVIPVIKHLPGHGRAASDSHLSLPVVTTKTEDLARTDFAPFRNICQKPFAAGLWGMVAHVVYTDIDPNNPASVSGVVINNIIRGDIGFNGLLFSDDLDMKALESYGSIANRAILSLQAGCDLALYCWAKMDVMERMAADLPPLSARGWMRWEQSLNASWQDK